MSTLILIVAFIGLGGWLAWYLISKDHGSREPVGALWLAVAFGLLAAIVSVVAETLLIPERYLSSPATGSLPIILAVSMTIGLIEEAFKFLPLAAHLYKKPYFNERTDGIIYFALAGLGFGVPENILYAVGFGTKSGLIRLILTPFFHAATAAFVGYFFVRAKLERRSFWSVVGAFLLMVALHGLYDFGLLADKASVLFVVISLMITVGVTVYMFLIYRRATAEDQANGLSLVAPGSQAITNERKASLGLLFGALAIPAAVVPIIGFGLGIAGLAVGSRAHSLYRQRISTLAIIVSWVGISLSTGLWAYTFLTIK